jgi:hypothetical protein
MSPTIATADIEQITGYKRPHDQLLELHRQGFYRARRSPTTGHIILERVHYDAVCVGFRQQTTAPQVRVPQLRAA